MAAGILTTSSHSSDLVPLTGFYIGDKYKDFDREYPHYMDLRKSDRIFERIVMDAGLGLSQKKPEGAQIKLDSMSEVWTHDIYHTVYATGFAITKEAVDDAIMGVALKKKSRTMAKSLNDTKETVCALHLDRAFNSNFTFGDGKEICSTAHPLQYGGTNSNKLASDADLSEGSLEQAIKDLGDLTDQRGLKIKVKAERLLVHKDDDFNAFRILKSVLRVASAEHDPNALRQMSSIPGGYVPLHYPTDKDAWFLQTDVEDGLMLFERHGVELSEHNDDLSKNRIVLAMERYGTSLGDSSALFGSQGQ